MIKSFLASPIKVFGSLAIILILVLLFILPYMILTLVVAVFVFMMAVYIIHCIVYNEWLTPRKFFSLW